MGESVPTIKRIHGRPNMNDKTKEGRLRIAPIYKHMMTILAEAEPDVKRFDEGNITAGRRFGRTLLKYKKLADAIPGGCGCGNRKKLLNKMFPYKK